jgi:hypothetical protein
MGEHFPVKCWVFASQRQFEPPLAIQISMARPAVAASLAQIRHHFITKRHAFPVSQWAKGAKYRQNPVSTHGASTCIWGDNGLMVLSVSQVQ